MEHNEVDVRIKRMCFWLGSTSMSTNDLLTQNRLDKRLYAPLRHLCYKFLLAFNGNQSIIVVPFILSKLMPKKIASTQNDTTLPEYNTQLEIRITYFLWGPIISNWQPAAVVQQVGNTQKRLLTVTNKANNVRGNSSHETKMEIKISMTGWQGWRKAKETVEKKNLLKHVHY